MNVASDVEYAILGIVQGIAEWLPISSKTAVMLFSAYVFGYALKEAYEIGLGLQGGTVVAALAYFLPEYRSFVANKELLKRLAIFLVISTAVTGVVGSLLYLWIRRALGQSYSVGIPSVVVGVLLLVQALLARRSRGCRGMGDVGLADSLLFGFVQGLAAAPGVSRSGVTVTLLLYLGYTLDDSLRLSYLASILANAGATGLVLLTGDIGVHGIDLAGMIVALVSSAAVGYLTISYMLKLASKHSRKLTLSMGLIAIAVGLAAVMAH